MNIDYTVTALMFPAIPLIMGVYSNRFHTLSNLIRKIHDEHVFEKHTPPEWKNQLINLNDRIGVLKLTIMFGSITVVIEVFECLTGQLFAAIRLACNPEKVNDPLLQFVFVPPSITPTVNTAPVSSEVDSTKPRAPVPTTPFISVLEYVKMKGL